MTPLNSDGSVVIAGLGLRLGPQPAEPLTTIIPPTVNPNLVRVFVTELVPGGAAERSQLLRLNDEILHVDHIPTAGRTVVSVPSLYRYLKHASSVPNRSNLPMNDPLMVLTVAKILFYSTGIFLKLHVTGGRQKRNPGNSRHFCAHWNQVMPPSIQTETKP
jgi:hypothetical protein